MVRISSYLLFALAAVFLMAGDAMAAVWKITQTAGQVTVTAPMAPARPAKAGETLAPGATLTTGADGKAVLTDDKSVVKVGPGTRLTMPADSTDDMTRFLQDLGTILFTVEKRKEQHFEVRTPLIAAVVKGTEFEVTVTPSDHAVKVTEGLVEVHAVQGGLMEMLPAGRTARVRVDAPSRLDLTANKSAAAKPGSGSTTGAVTEAIGAEPLNYASLTDGLLAVVPGTLGAIEIGLTPKGNGGSNATEATASIGGVTASASISDMGVVADVGIGGGDGGVVDAAVSASIDLGSSGGGLGGGGVGVALDTSVGGAAPAASAALDVGLTLPAPAAGTGLALGAGADLSAGPVQAQLGVGVGIGGTPPAPGNGGTTISVGPIHIGLGLGRGGP